MSWKPSRAANRLSGSEEGPLEPVPLTEDSALRSKPQTYPPQQLKLVQKLYSWVDDEYDKIPVERAIVGESTAKAVRNFVGRAYEIGRLIR